MEMIHELRLFHYPNKIRYGDNGDGGCVVADLDIKYDCYISAGIAEEESFTRDFLQAHSYVGREIVMLLMGLLMIILGNILVKFNLLLKISA